jgi:hypothetical protein
LNVEEIDTPIVDETKLPMHRDDANIAAQQREPPHLATSSVLIALSIVAVFLPVLVIRYAFLDDYSILASAKGLQPSTWGLYASGGRPLAGLVVPGLFSAAGDISGLRYIRLLSIAGIVCLALLLHWRLNNAGIGRRWTTLIAIFIATLPAFQVYASWATLSAAPYAAILGAGASLTATRATTMRPPALFIRGLLSVVMLTAGLLIYQPMAMFFWIFFLIEVVFATHSVRTRRVISSHAIVAAASAAVAFVAFKIGVHVYGGLSPERSSTVTDISGKARWFANQPLIRSLNLIDLTPRRSVAILVAVTAVVGGGLWLRRQSRLSAGVLGLAVLTIPLAYAPNLVVTENWASLRSQGALDSIVALEVALGALGLGTVILDVIRHFVGPRIVQGVVRLGFAAAVVFVSLSAALAAKNVTTLFAEPQNIELRALEGEIASIPDAKVGRIGVVQLGWWQGTAPLVVYDEFGQPSMAATWVPIPAVLLTLSSEKRLRRGVVVDVLRPDQCCSHARPHRGPPTPGEPRIDIRALERLRG